MPLVGLSGKKKGVIKIDVTHNTEKAQVDGQVVVFSLGDEKYGIEIAAVKEIVKWRQTTKLPQSSEELLGVIKLREQVIPVMSLRRYFGWPEAQDEEDTKIIILDMDNLLLGIRVDDVDAVVRVSSSDVDRSDALTATSEMIYGIAKFQEELLILLDIKSMFASDVIDQFIGEDTA